MSDRLILVDVDGVLANFVDPVLTLANKLAGTNYTSSDMQNWEIFDLPGLRPVEDEVWKQIEAAGWAQTVPIYEGAQDGIRMLSKYGTLRILTSPVTAPTFVWDRNAWLQTHFNITSKQVMYAYDKAPVEGSLFIDDKVSNIKGWIARHGSKRDTRAVLWAQPWNDVDHGHHPRVVRTNSWAQIEDMLAATTHGAGF